MNKSTQPSTATSAGLRLAGSESLLQSRLLGRGDGEFVGALDLNPGSGVVAVDSIQRGQPLVGCVRALLTVGLGGDGPQLWALNIVGKGLALRASPLRGTGLEGSR